MFKFFRKYQKYMLAAFVIVLMVAFLVQPSLTMFTPKAENQILYRLDGQPIIQGEVRAANADIELLPALFLGGILRTDMPDNLRDFLRLSGLGDRMGSAILDVAPDTSDPVGAILNQGADETAADRARLRAHRDPLRWLLMLHEAQRLGLGASEQSVTQMLKLLGLPTEADVADFAAQTRGARPEDLRHALRNWAIVQQYQDLVCGYQVVAPVERLHYYLKGALATFNAALTQFGARQKLGELKGSNDLQAMLDQMKKVEYEIEYTQRLAHVITNADRNKVWLSEPMAQRFLDDDATLATVELVPVSYRKYEDVAAKLPQEVVDKKAQELYDLYCNTLPRQGQPFPFGYRFPDRVKIEYLAFPIDKVRDSIQIQGWETRRYFDGHLAYYRAEYDRRHAGPTTAPSSQPATLPASAPVAATRPAATDDQVYEDMMDRVERDLRKERAPDECQRLVSDAQTRLDEAQRRLEVSSDGYHVVPEPALWQPREAGTQALPTGLGATTMPSAHAESMAGLKDDLHFQACSYVAASDWKNVQDLKDNKTFKELADADLVQARGRERAPFTDYVLSAKEFSPRPENRLLKERLQRGIVSQPLRDTSGSMYLFRLIDVQATHAPKSLDEVREATDRDARHLLAYERLNRDDINHLNELVTTTAKLDDLLSTADPENQKLGIRRPKPFARREVLPDGTSAAPDVEGAGRSPAFVARVFDLAEGIQTSTPGSPIDKVAIAQRSAAVPADNTLAICLTRLVKFNPITRSAYANLASAPDLPFQIDARLMAGAGAGDPLSLESLKKRTKFVDEAKGGSADAE